MARRPRLVLPDVPLHVIQRGNNRQNCFSTTMDYHCYLKWLGEYAQQFECRIHAYVLMTNHVHLLLTPARAEAPSALMKALGQRYVGYYNRTYRRTGSLWEGRFRSCLVQAEDYLLVCHRYIELNPVRAGMVKHPADYPWSSYRANAHNHRSEILSPHDIYRHLGPDTANRQAIYRRLFDDALDPKVVDSLRHASNGNYVMGDACFAKRVAVAVGHHATPQRSGRRPARRT